MAKDQIWLHPHRSAAPQARAALLQRNAAWPQPMPGRHTPETGIQASQVTRHGGDFERDVYCLAGMPIDAIDMEETVSHVRSAARLGMPCFLSTPNLNFLIAAQHDAAFRDSIINSDLSTVDGMPVVWLARLLGIPVRERVAGSDMIEEIDAQPANAVRPLSVYLFGGHDGVAQRARERINAAGGGITCCGAHSPGFGAVGSMSSDALIEEINASGADFLIVALGARKGQAWIEHNRARITVPVISHLGAVVDFLAGTVSRAPKWMQRAGLEWLWRIKEEPALWKRYRDDGLGLLRLLLVRLLPYAAWRRINRHGHGKRMPGTVRLDTGPQCCRISVLGDMPDAVPISLRRALRQAASRRSGVTVDCSAAGYLSPAFFGLLLMLQKHQTAAARPLRVIATSTRIRLLFRWNGLGHLLAAPPAAMDECPDDMGMAGATSL